jgi:hypothetical protein
MLNLVDRPSNLLHLLAGGAGTTDAVVATRGRVITGHAR